MTDYASLGRMVKQKYPQYASIDDALLGEKIATKYPEYAKMFTTSSDIPVYGTNTPSQITINQPTPPAARTMDVSGASTGAPTGGSPLPEQPSPSNTTSVSDPTAITNEFLLEQEKINKFHNALLVDPQYKNDEDAKKTIEAQRKTALDAAKTAFSAKMEGYDKVAATNKTTKTETETRAQTEKDYQDIVDTAQKLLQQKTEDITGWNQYGTEANLPGTKGQYTKALLNQIKGKLVLLERAKMKGTGAISDKESAWAAQAASALNSNLSNEDFRKVLEKDIIGKFQKDIAPDLKTMTPTTITPSTASSTLPPIGKNGDMVRQRASEALKRNETLMSTTPESVYGSNIATKLAPKTFDYLKQGISGNIKGPQSLPELGQNIGAMTLGPAGELMLGTKEQKKKAGAGLEGANLAMAASGIANLAQKGLNYAGAAGRAGSINPGKVAQQVRGEAVQRFNEAGGNIEPIKQKVSTWLDNYIAKTDSAPQVIKKAQEIKSTIANHKNLDDVLNAVTTWQKQSFGPGGAKTTNVPVMMEQLAPFARKVIGEVAPEVAKHTPEIGQGFSLAKGAAKIGSKLVESAGYAIPFALLTKYLGDKITSLKNNY